MKHIHENIQGWFTFPSFYTQLVNQAKDGYKFVEVGTWKGKSAAYMAVEIINSNKNIEFDCIDTWNGSEEHVDTSSPFYEPLLSTPDGLYNHFLSNIDSVKRVVNPIRKASLEAVSMYEDKSLNCVFIDAAHDYDNVCNDIKAWLPKIKPGGVLAGHDICHPPIKQAVIDILNDEIIAMFEQDIWIHKVKK